MKRMCKNCIKSNPYEQDKFFIKCSSYESFYDFQDVAKLEPATGLCKSYIPNPDMDIDKPKQHENERVKVGRVAYFVSYRTPPRMGGNRV